MSRRSPVLTIALGILLLALSFVIHGPTRDLILRAAGVVGLVVGLGMWVASRPR